MASRRATGRVGGEEVAHVAPAAADWRWTLAKRRKFARRTVPVDASPLKKRRCAAALEDENAAAAADWRWFLGKRRKFARRTVPVNASPIKKRRCPAALEDEHAAAADVGEGSGPEGDALLDSCGGVAGYKLLDRVGKGSYGVVFRARERATGETVAVKKSTLDMAAIGEITVLKSLPAHPRIVGLKEVIFDRRDGPVRDVYLVMEYLDSDLLGAIRAAPPLSEATAKFLMRQLLEGVAFLHANGVMHRDLKPSNLLLNLDGDLKICDFGLSRHCIGGIREQQPYTNLVVTRWYRAPEILLKADGYSSAIDMWSVGCIMGELLAGTPLFPGENELDQLDWIFCVLGVPDEATWPEFPSLCSKMKVVFAPRSNTLLEKLPRSSLSDAGLDLLAGLLAYDPSRRPTAAEALNHPWFREVPAPTRPNLLF